MGVGALKKALWVRVLRRTGIYSKHSSLSQSCVISCSWVCGGVTKVRICFMVRWQGHKRRGYFSTVCWRTDYSSGTVTCQAESVWSIFGGTKSDTSAYSQSINSILLPSSHKLSVPTILCLVSAKLASPTLAVSFQSKSSPQSTHQTARVCSSLMTRKWLASIPSRRGRTCAEDSGSATAAQMVYCRYILLRASHNVSDRPDPRQS